MQPMSAVRAFLLPALTAGLFGMSEPARTQQVEPPLSLEEVRICLCLEQEMTAHKSEMDLRDGILKERENELERISMEIETKRATMNPGDPQAIADLRALIDRQQTLRSLIRRDILPSYQSSVEAYNTASSSYNEQCAGRRIYRTDVEKLQGNLQCPAQP